MERRSATCRKQSRTISEQYRRFQGEREWGEWVDEWNHRKKEGGGEWQAGWKFTRGEVMGRQKLDEARRERRRGREGK
jgi:hypothetical protein